MSQLQVPPLSTYFPTRWCQIHPVSPESHPQLQDLLNTAVLYLQFWLLVLLKNSDLKTNLREMWMCYLNPRCCRFEWRGIYFCFHFLFGKTQNFAYFLIVALAGSLSCRYTWGLAQKLWFRKHKKLTSGFRAKATT